MRLHDHAAERALLGLLATVSARSPQQARDLAQGLGLAADDLEHAPHAAIWRASLGVLARGHALEASGVSAEIAARRESCGLTPLLDALNCATAMSASEAEPLAARIRDLAARRRLVEAADSLRAMAESASEAPEMSALAASARLANIGASGAEKLGTLRDDLDSYLARLEAVERGEAIACVPTGIEIWDEMLGGLQAGVVTFVGAQPSVGKSALVGSIARNVARAGHIVGLFSLEDSPEWLAERGLAWESGIPVHRLATAKLFHGEGSDLQNAAARIHDWSANVVRDGRSGLTARQVAATARQMIAQRGARVILVDHLGELELEGRHDRHDLAVADAVRQLRDVAKDTGVPVVVCAHFARPPKSNDEPRYQRPTSSSWANSAGVERMARVAVGLYLAKEAEGEVRAVVLKQTRGDKDFDFAMRMHRPSGLINNVGGQRIEHAKSHHEQEIAP